MPRNRIPPKPVPGSRKGCPNRSTSNAREAIARFVDGNAERLQGWLDEIAETQGPEKAFKCVVDLIEYHVPKLARTELTGGGEGSEPVRVRIHLVDPKEDEGK